MAEPSRTSAGHSIADLKELVKHDLEVSNELQFRIESLRQELKEGKTLPKQKIDLMEGSNKDMTKDLVARIEQIEATNLTATDREMLQALNARLAVCDVQAMRLAELRELECEARGEQHDFLEPEDSYPLQRTVSAPGVLDTVNNDNEHIEDVTRLGQHEPMPIAAEGHERRNQAYYSDDEEFEVEDDHHDDEIQSETDMSSWPGPYKVLEIHPDTPDDEIVALTKKSMATLAAKHDPRRLPNDDGAPGRWAVIEKARDVLCDVEKRRFLDRHQQVPAGLEDAEIDKLNLG